MVSPSPLSYRYCLTLARLNKEVKVILDIGQRDKRTKGFVLFLAALVSGFFLAGQVALSESASADGSSISTSCSTSNGVVTSASITFSVSYGAGITVTKWEYSFDGTSYADISGASGFSGSLNPTDWYSNTLDPYIRATNSVGAVTNLRSSSTCIGMRARSFAPRRLKHLNH